MHLHSLTFFSSKSAEKDVRKILQDIETENIRLKTENAAVTATLQQERERMRAYESKIIRYETSLDQLNRKLRDKEEYISSMERTIGEKQHQLAKTEHEKEKQRHKFSTKMAEENEKMMRETQMKLNEQKRTLEQNMRSQEEKLRLVTDIVNDNSTAPVSSLIQRFNSNCDNIEPPGSERKPRTRVSWCYNYVCIKRIPTYFLNSFNTSDCNRRKYSPSSIKVSWD